MNFSILKLLRPIMGIGASNAGGMLVYILIFMFLTRIISPDVLGIFGYYMTIVAVGSLLASLGLECAIISSRSRHEALLVTGGVFYVSALGSLIVVCGVALLQELDILTQHIGVTALVLCLPSIFLGNCYYALQFLKTRSCDYKALSKGGFSNNALRGVFQAGACGVMPAGIHPLIIGETLGRAASIFMISSVREILLAIYLPVKHPSRLLRSLRLKIHDSLHFLFANVLETILFWVPLLLFGRLYGLETAGYVALIIRLFSGPIQVISRAVADVYHGQAQKYAHEHRSLFSLTLRLWSGVLLIGLLIPVFLWLLGEDGFEILFGSQWREAYGVSLAMSPLLITLLLTPIATRIGLVKNLLKARIIYILSCFMVATFLYFFGKDTFADPVDCIFFYSAFCLFMCILYIWFIAKNFFQDPPNHDSLENQVLENAPST